MYFFYFDESGSRDPSSGTVDAPKDHLYVLLAVGMYEGQWKPFETAVSGLKLELIESLRRRGIGNFDLADCEIKSNWVRLPTARARRSPFLHALREADLTRLTEIYYGQVVARKTVVMASVIDKRRLHAHMTHETLHKKAYEFLLERIQHYMRAHHRKHRALIVMDDTSRQLNRAVAMKHALFQRTGNQNMTFPAIVEYPFFTRSELSNGVQLADLLAYNVYRAFRTPQLDYPRFARLLPNFYQSPDGKIPHGLKVWPGDSSLVEAARQAWEAHQRG